MSLTGQARSDHGSLRSRLRSPSGFVSVGLALSLLVGSVAVALGQGASKALLDLGDGAVWLPTDPRGVVTLIDGTSGRPTAEIQVATGDGTNLQVVYRDGMAYAYDASTGVLTLIDDASRSASLAVDTGGGAGTTVLAGSGTTYVVDVRTGEVQVLDGESLEPTGEPFRLGGALGSAVVDGEGVLWASLTEGGRVVSADEDGVRGTLKVTDGATAPLTVVGGVVHALDVAAGQVRVLEEDSVSEAMPLSVARNADPGQLLVSAASDRDIAVLDPASCQVAVLAVQVRTSASVALPRETCGDDFGDPVVVGNRVFVPNYSTGGTLVLDITGREAPSEVEVRADGPGEFDLFLDDGNVVANDPSSNEAVIFSGGTEAIDVTKFDEEVAENATRPKDTPADLPEPEPADRPEPRQPKEPDPAPATTPTDEPTDEPTESGGPGNPPSGPSAPGVPDPAGPAAPQPTDPGGTPPEPPTQEPPAEPPVEPPAEPPVEPPAEPPAEPPVEPPAADPAQPRITDVSVGNHRNVVTFEPGVGGGPVTSFSLAVASGGGDPQITSSGPNQFTAVFGGCALHSFVVVANGENGASVRSAPSAERPACPATPPVTGLDRSDVTHDAVTLSWNKVDGTGPVTYRVERGNGDVVRGFENGRQIRITGLEASREYTFRVIAKDDAGQSEPTSISVTTKAPPPPPVYATWTIQDTNLGGTCATQGPRGGAWAGNRGECKGWNQANRWLDNGTKVDIMCAVQGDGYDVYPGPERWNWYFKTRAGDWIRAGVIQERTGNSSYGAPAC